MPYSPYFSPRTRAKARLISRLEYLKPFLRHAKSFLIDNQIHIERGNDEVWKIVKWALWKHHFSPIETSNALAWLTIPAYYVVPQRAHINELPVEILVKIFAHVLHSDCREPKDFFCHEIQRRISSGSSPTTPLVMTHVSRFWREVVHSAPILWSTIKVLCPLTTDVEYISFLLGKTGNCPLNLSLEQYMTPDPASLAIANLFVSQAHRWRSVSFTFYRCIQDVFGGLTPGDVPLLEDYRVRLDGWDPDRIERVFEVLHSSNKLKSIDWGKSLSGRMIELPWSRLTEITLHCMELSHHAFVSLSQCEHLTTLRMRRVVHVIFPTVVFSRLEKLVCDRHGNFQAIFNALTLPALVELELTDRNPLPVASVNALGALLDRSRCTLHTLSIDGHSVYFLSRMSQFLTTTTTLNILSDIAVEIECLKKPLWVVRPELLPNLENLILHNCWALDGSLAEVVWSRRHKLLRIQVCMYPEKSPRDYMTLGWLAKDGVLVSIHEPVSRYSNFFFQVNRRDPSSDIVPMIHFPDTDTLW